MLQQKVRLVLGWMAVTDVAVGLALAITVLVSGSTVWEALPVGWITAWVTGVVSITAYLAWAEKVDLQQRVRTMGMSPAPYAAHR
jgi:hypothetical protein